MVTREGKCVERAIWLHLGAEVEVVVAAAAAGVAEIGGVMIRVVEVGIVAGIAGETAVEAEAGTEGEIAGGVEMIVAIVGDASSRIFDMSLLN